MARTKRTARNSTGGRVSRHQLAPREPRPEPTEAERLRAELAEVTAARNAAQQQLEQVIHDRDQETLAVQRLTVAHRNYQRMLVHVMNQRDETWHEENILRARQVELEQQLEATEEYNENLHEEVHRLNN
jgi:chromosome segregation ATPase